MKQKTIRVSIILDFKAELNDNGGIDEIALKESLYSYLGELTDEDQLSYSTELIDQEIDSE